MLDMNTLASKGPRGDRAHSTPSACSCSWTPSNWNSCPLVATLQGCIQRSVNGQCPVKNRFCPAKSLDGRTICPAVYADKENLEFPVLHIERFNSIGICEKGGEKKYT